MLNETRIKPEGQSKARDEFLTYSDITNSVLFTRSFVFVYFTESFCIDTLCDVCLGLFVCLPALVWTTQLILFANNPYDISLHSPYIHIM